MNSTNKLREEFKKYLDTLNDKDAIDKVASIVKVINDVDAEANTIAAKNNELRDAYIEVVKHSSFKDAPKDDVAPETKSFDEIFTEALKNIK